MLGNLYEFVKTTIVGNVPLEFEFVISIIVILIVILVMYCAFFGFIFIKDLIGGR